MNQIEEINKLLSESYEIRVSDLPMSILLSLKALTLSTKLADDVLIAKSKTQLSLFFMINGDHEKALEYAHAAKKIYKLTKNERGIADASFTLASVYYKTDNFHLGLRYLFYCIDVFRKYDDKYNLARALKSVGTIYEFFNDEADAIKVYEEAREISKEINDLNLKSNILNPLSGIYLNQGKTELALQTIERSISIKLNTGDVRGLAFAYYGRGKVYTKLGEFDKAEEDLLHALEIHRSMGEKIGESIALYKLGYLFYLGKNYKKAKEYLDEGINITEKYNIATIKIRCYKTQYLVSLGEGNNNDALKYLTIYTNLQDDIFNKQTLNSYQLLINIDARHRQEKLELEKANMLVQKNKAEFIANVKQDFISSMSHEIRTPLNAIITISNLLNVNTKDKDEVELIDSLKFASNNLMQLLNNVLDFSKLESNMMEVENKPTNLKDLLKNIISFYSPMSSEKGLLLNLNIDERISEVFQIDELKFSQIFGNLINNAIKFTDTGSITLVASLNESKDNIQTVCFKIIDTGKGITEEFKDKIFNKFSQSKTSNKINNNGTGLGLAIVKKIIKLYKSDIFVDSTLGKGSTFFFDIDLETASLKTWENDKEITDFKNLKLLLVDDNRLNILVASKLLSTRDIICDTATNGYDAIEKCKHKKYDIILMDIHMPVLNGSETSIIIKANGCNKGTPIYALSADINTPFNEVFKNSFKGFLNKPIEPEKLFKILSLE